MIPVLFNDFVYGALIRLHQRVKWAQSFIKAQLANCNEWVWCALHTETNRIARMWDNCLLCIL